MYTRLSIVTVSLLVIIATALGSIKASQDEKEEYKCGEHISLRGKREKYRAADGEFPFLANITIIEQDPTDSTHKLVYNCSGAILSNRRILTSIKCIGRDYMNNNNNNNNNINNNSTNNSTINFKISIGSNLVGGGKLLKFKRFHNFTYDLYKQDKAEDDDIRVRHGLALIKFSPKIKYKLANITTTTKIRKRKNKVTTSNKDLSINRICYNPKRTYPEIEANLSGIEMFAPNWMPGYKQAKAIPMEITKCPDETDGRSICANSLSKIDYGSLQEGTPLVVYTDRKRWQLIGIHSRRFEPWSDCDDDRCAKETQNFIPVHERRIKKWMKKTIYGTRSTKRNHLSSQYYKKTLINGLNWMEDM